MTKLFVCYHAVTALTERFCQNAFAPEGDGGRVQACQLQAQLAGPTRPPTNCSFSTMGFGAPLALRKEERVKTSMR
jgi:hypothetical protein